MKPATRPDQRGQRGFALLIVLWAMVMLSFVATRVTASGHGAVLVAANLRNAAVVEAAADGAVQEAIFRMLDTSAARWRPDGRPRTLPMPRGEILLRLDDQAGKVNPNLASVELLTALLRQLGVDSQGANRLAAAIADWRAPTAEARPFGAKAREYRNAGLGYGPPDAPFQSIGELGAVLGMTPPLLARLAPYLSLFNDGDPEPGLADPLVLRALRGSLGAQEFAESPQTGRRVVAISATAIQRGRGGGGTPAADSARFARRAVVRVGEGSNGVLYQILAWGIEED